MGSSPESDKLLKFGRKIDEMTRETLSCCIVFEEKQAKSKNGILGGVRMCTVQVDFRLTVR